MKRIIVSLFVMARLAASEISGPAQAQLLNDQKYSTAVAAIAHLKSNALPNDAQEQSAFNMFQEILSAAARDPESVNPETLFDARIEIAALYAKGIGTLQDLAKAKKLLLPLSMVIRSCFLMGTIKFRTGDLPMAEQFFRQILMYDARYPKVSKVHEDVRYYTERSRLMITEVEAGRGNLRVAIAYFRAAEKNIRRNPIPNPAMSSHVKTHLDITRKLVTQALQRGMSAHVAENLEPARIFF